MDEAERVPIDLGYEAAATGDGQIAITRSTTRDDGTIVIDILAQPECGVSEQADIVVCASAPEGSAEPPPPENIADQMGDALNAQVGPLEVGSIKRPDGTRSFGARIRF